MNEMQAGEWNGWRETQNEPVQDPERVKDSRLETQDSRLKTQDSRVWSVPPLSRLLPRSPSRTLSKTFLFDYFYSLRTLRGYDSRLCCCVCALVRIVGGVLMFIIYSLYIYIYIYMYTEYIFCVGARWACYLCSSGAGR